MSVLLETRKLTKSYKGKKVVDQVSMHVEKGRIYGFVGPNGAGKTTILKMLLNLTPPDGGEIVLFGKPLQEQTFEHLKRIGSIIENPYFYDRLTGRENLEMHCGYMGYPNVEEIDRVLSMVGLDGTEGKAVVNYSLGMKQRLAIARAILTRPELLILDEPINALDPDGIQKMRSLFCRLNEEWGTTILISSHILSEVELIADTIGIIQEGVLKQEASMEEIHNRYTDYMEIQVEDPGRAGCLLEQELQITDYKIFSDHMLRVYTPAVSGRVITALLVENGISPESIFKKKNSLEEYFFHMTGEGEV